MSEEIATASADLREIARLRIAAESAQRLADDWEHVANRQRAELDVALKECEQWRRTWRR